MNKILCILFAFSQLLATQAVVIEDKSNLKILTPSFKDRKTMKLKLENGLSVYIVSDKQIDQSSAALCVKAGSWQDPKTYPGMAHFTEHMLFMGSKTYPGENAFMNFIWDHGGSPNAYTACDRTVYGFSILNDAFTDGLRRFSHFFIDPIFPPEGMKKELHAVDQEYAKNIENDGWRKYMIEKQLANHDHPHHGFSTGNSTTLGHIPQNEMIKWFEEHYSANNMYLFISSPLDIEELQKITIEQFSKIPNRKLSIFDQKMDVFSNDQKGKIVFIEPIKDLQIISLSWELPNSFNNDSSQSAELLGYAFSGGSKKSLLQLLKKQNLADDLETNVERIGNQATFFQIDVSLTNKGLLYYPRVLEHCFEAIKTFSATPIPKYLSEQRKKMKKINYEYQSRSDAFNFAMKSADNMADEELATYPAKKVIIKDFNEKKVHQVLKHLTPENVTVFVISDPKKLSISLDKQEKWLGGKYSVKPLELNLAHVKINPEIEYPKPNFFIPNNLAIEKHNPLKDPVEISSSKKDQAYYFPDSYYKVPEVAYLLQIQSPLINGDAEASCLTDLWIRGCSDTLSPTLLAAKEAGLMASISSESFMIKLQVAGFSEKAHLLLEEVLKGMEKTPSKEQFNIYRNSLLKAYSNKDKDLPVSQASNLAKTLLMQNVVSNEQKYESLKDITYDKYVLFYQSVLKKTYLESLYTGNIGKAQATKIHNKVLSLLQSEPFTEHYEKKVLHIPSNEGPFMIEKKTSSLGNACFLVLDEGSFSFTNRACHQILSQALHSDFFASLRTKQKTGYIAQSVDSVIENQLFQFFAVQSNSHEPLDLLYRFDLFLDDFSQDISDKISNQRFDLVKKSLEEQLKTPPVNLFENAARLQLFAFEYKDFSWIEKRLNGLKNLGYNQFLQMSAPLISRKNKKRIAILFSGNIDRNNGYRYEPTSALEMKKAASYFPKSIVAN